MVPPLAQSTSTTPISEPPATTPEAEASQKMMKYMMVFMGVMFYKVPSGLGIYFITSSLWQISERLLLPKMAAKTPAPDAGGTPPGGGRGNNGDGAPAKPPGKLTQLWEKVLDEAKKDPTYRKMMEERDSGKDKDKDRDSGKDKPRARSGKRR